jgi:hypothetical protein
MSRDTFSSILIDPANPSQVQCWANELQVDPSELKAAMVTVGRRLSDIRRYLGKTAQIIYLHDRRRDRQTKRETWTAFHPVI